MKRLTKAERRNLYLSNLTQRYGKVNVEEYKGLTIMSAGAVVAIFTAKAGKPYAYYNMGTVEKLNTYIAREKKSHDQDLEAAAKRLKANTEESDKIQKDTILRASWGYDQTNIDFYQVIERKGSFVIVQAIGQDSTVEGFDYGKCTPNTEIKIGEPFRRKVSQYASVKIDSSANARIWSGKPQTWTSGR